MDLPIIGVGVVAVLQVIQLILQWRLEAQIKADVEWQSKTREQAARVAEYLAAQVALKSDSSAQEYQRINQLGFELAMWLPDNLYRAMAQAAIEPHAAKHLEVVIAARKLLLGNEAGDLSTNDVLVHAPNVGRRRIQSQENETVEQ